MPLIFNPPIHYPEEPDFYHFREHLIKTGQDLFGEGTAAATAWKDKMVTVGLEQGSLVLLDRLGDCLATTTEAQ